MGGVNANNIYIQRDQAGRVYMEIPAWFRHAMTGKYCIVIISSSDMSAFRTRIWSACAGVRVGRGFEGRLT